MNHLTTLLTIGLTISLLVASTAQAQTPQFFASDASVTVIPIGPESNVKQGFTPSTGQSKNLYALYINNDDAGNRFSVANIALPFYGKVVHTYSPFNGIVAVNIPLPSTTGATDSLLYILAMNWGTDTLAASVSSGTPSHTVIIIESDMEQHEVLQAITNNPQSKFRYLKDDTNSTYDTFPITLNYNPVGDLLGQFLQYDVEKALKLSNFCFETDSDTCKTNITNDMETR
jgi:hypothetical protein